MFGLDVLKTNNSIADSYIKNYKYLYEVLYDIEKIIMEIGKNLNSSYIKKGDNIWIHESAIVSDSSEIHGPCIIDEGAVLRHNSYIRGNVIVGKNVLVGNSCEVKNSILYDECHVAHFNYVGDSIIGYHSNLGAGAVLSNVRYDKSNIIIKYNGKTYDTGLYKFGSIIGDEVFIGCNSVLNPGTIVFSNSFIYPLVNVSGVVLENKIVKSSDVIVDKK